MCHNPLPTERDEQFTVVTIQGRFHRPDLLALSELSWVYKSDKDGQVVLAGHIDPASILRVLGGSVAFNDLDLWSRGSKPALCACTSAFCYRASAFRRNPYRHQGLRPLKESHVSPKSSLLSATLLFIGVLFFNF